MHFSFANYLQSAVREGRLAYQQRPRSPDESPPVPSREDVLNETSSGLDVLRSIHEESARAPVGLFDTALSTTEIDDASRHRVSNEMHSVLNEIGAALREHPQLIEKVVQHPGILSHLHEIIGVIDNPQELQVVLTAAGVSNSEDRAIIARGILAIANKRSALAGHGDAIKDVIRKYPDAFKQAIERLAGTPEEAEGAKAQLLEIAQEFNISEEIVEQAQGFVRSFLSIFQKDPEKLENMAYGTLLSFVKGILGWAAGNDAIAFTGIPERARTLLDGINKTQARTRVISEVGEEHFDQALFDIAYGKRGRDIVADYRATIAEREDQLLLAKAKLPEAWGDIEPAPVLQLGQNPAVLFNDDGLSPATVVVRREDIDSENEYKIAPTEVMSTLHTAYEIFNTADVDRISIGRVAKIEEREVIVTQNMEELEMQALLVPMEGDDSVADTTTSTT